MPKSYGSKTLMGNWFEDRLAPSKVRTKLNLRGSENEVPTVRIKRFEDATTQGTIADYCQNDFSTTTKTSFRWVKPHTNQSEEVRMIRLKTFSPEQSTRHVDGPVVGFGAILPRHATTYSERLLTSTTHSAFGGPNAEDDELRNVPEGVDRNIPAGLTYDGLQKKEQAMVDKLLSPDKYPATSLCGMDEFDTKAIPKLKARRTGVQIWQQ